MKTGILFKKAMLITRESFLEWKVDYRVWVLGFLSVVVVIRYLYGVDLYGITFSTKVTPFLLPVLFKDAGVANGLVKILLYLGSIFLFSNAPFINDAVWHQWIRTGKKVWILGKCLYIICASFVYMAFLSVTAFLTVLPTVTFNDLWGSTLRDWISDKNTWAFYAGNLEIPKEVIRMVYPWSAQLLTFIAGSLSFSLVGHLICFLNLSTGMKATGTGAAVTLVMIDPVIHYFAFSEQQKWFYLFSPVSWSSIELWDIVGSGKPLNAGYVFAATVLLTLALASGIIVRIHSWEGIRSQ